MTVHKIYTLNARICYKFCSIGYLALNYLYKKLKLAFNFGLVKQVCDWMLIQIIETKVMLISIIL